MIHELIEQVQREWSALGMSGPAPARLRVLQTGRGSLRWHRVTFLIFDQRGRQCLCAQTLRDPDLSRTLAGEQEILTRLRSELPRPIALTLPETVGLLHLGGAAVLVTRALPGHNLSLSLQAACGRSDRRQDCGEILGAARWLQEFHAATARGKIVLTGEMLARHVQDPLAEFAEVFGLTGARRRQVDLLGDQACQALEGRELPLVCQHGDFWHSNLLEHQGKIFVLDWEWSEEGALPLLDLFTFPACFAFEYAYRDGRLLPRSQALQMVLTGSSWAGKAAEAFWNCYREVSPVAPEVVISYAPVALARLATREWKRYGERSEAAERWGELLLGLIPG